MAHPEEKGEVEENLGIYVGGRSSDGERHGPGWALLPNGDFYKGCYSHGLRNACGLYVFMKSGARYKGEWRHAMKYGVGKFWYPDGSRYEGDWKHDMKQGFGAYYYTNGDIYEGAWFKNQRHGLGTYFYAQPQIKFMGTWVHGVIQGPGQIIYPRMRWHGAWNRGRPNGSGCFVFDTNCMQHGFYMYVKESKEMTGEEEEPEKDDAEKMMGEDEDFDENEGKIPVWRARNITAYMAEFLPPEAVPLPVHDSLPSLSEGSMVCDSLEFLGPSVVEEEQRSDHDSWLVQREKFLEETTDNTQEA